ncbi:MAG: DNA polymerase IV [Clostridiales bacterium]|nr:DNA polymerase IV [Clostridiales bacterium]
MTVLHIDANSAYLSWTAAWLIENGESIDLRSVPSAIGGNPKNRHGIILAKSIPAKKYGVKTGQSIMEALSQCPKLLIYPPDYDLYMGCSEAMLSIISEYSSVVERYSVDECFLDCTGSERIYGNPLDVADEIRNRIREELGFTVNVGIGPNKLLAKMAGELEKPDKTHSIFYDEVKEKLWPLPVSELFMVGRATTRKLNRINIKTIGDLANMDKAYLKAILKSHGALIWNYANGIDDSRFLRGDEVMQKGIGNSMTIKYDVYDKKEAYVYMLSLCERVGLRLRKHGFKASLVRVRVRSSDLNGYTHQLKLNFYTNTTSEIYMYACNLFDECWRGEHIRQLGVSVGGFTRENIYQMSFFDMSLGERRQNEKMDSAVDAIRNRFGETSIYRGTFANGIIKPLEGGTNNGNFISMGGHGK